LPPELFSTVNATPAPHQSIELALRLHLESI
jgi:hypothetical protein